MGFWWPDTTVILQVWSNYMSDEIGNPIRELIDVNPCSIFDRNRVQFKPEHERGVAPLRKSLGRPTTQTQDPPRKLARNALLCGCSDFTKSESVEHLIVGYGVKEGTGTDIYAAQRVFDDEGCVSIPNSIVEIISLDSHNLYRSEIVLLHNHPHYWPSALADNIPPPSSGDRKTRFQKRYLEPLWFIRFLLGIHWIHFHLCESEFVREIGIQNVMLALKTFNRQEPRGGYA